MWPIYVMPPWLDAASRLTFNRWALEGFLVIMAGATEPSAIARPVLVLVAMAAIFLAVGTRRLRFQ